MRFDLAFAGDKAMKLKPPISLVRPLPLSVGLLCSGAKASDQMAQPIVELLVRVIEVSLVLESQFAFNQVGCKVDASVHNPNTQVYKIRAFGYGRLIEPVPESAQGDKRPDLVHLRVRIVDGCI